MHLKQEYSPLFARRLWILAYSNKWGPNLFSNDFKSDSRLKGVHYITLLGPVVISVSFSPTCENRYEKSEFCKSCLDALKKSCKKKGIRLMII